MKQTILTLIIALTAGTTSLAGDTVVFKNGDVLTGRVIKQDDLHIVFEYGSAGSIQLNTEDVESVRLDTPAAGEAARPSAVVVPESAPPAPIKADPPVTEKPPPPAKVSRNWTGQAGLAIAMRETASYNTAGSFQEDQFNTYRIYGHINWAGLKNSLNWNWTYRYSEDETRKRDDFFNLTQKYNHTLNKSYYAEVKTIVQRDYNRNIDNEFLQTAEIGRKWFQLPKLELSTSIGGGYHQYERSLPGETGPISEPKFVFDESLEWKLINSLTLFQRYAHLGDLEDYNFVLTSGLENTLIRDVFLRLEYRYNRDTEASYKGNSYYDKALLTSLLYKF